MGSFFADTCERGERRFHFRRVVERFGLAGNSIHLQQAGKCIPVFAGDEVMHAVFKPTRARGIAVEVDALLRVENVVDGEELLLCKNRRGRNYDEKKRKERNEASSHVNLL